MTRKTITSRIEGESYSRHDFEDSVQTIITKMTELQARYPGQKLKLDYGQHDRWDDSEYYIVNSVRPETDEEYEARTRQESKVKEQHRQRELATLAELKKKYPDA